VPSTPTTPASTRRGRTRPPTCARSSRSARVPRKRLTGRNVGTTSEHPHQKNADRLEQEANYLEHKSDELAEDIEAAKDDWERKKADPGVPGTPIVPDEPDAGEETTDERQGPEAGSAKG
jgi:hypothetical protein